MCRRAAYSASGCKALRIGKCAGATFGKPNLVPCSLVGPEPPPLAIVPIRRRIWSKGPQPFAYAPNVNSELAAIQAVGHKGFWAREFVGCCWCGAYSDTSKSKRAVGLARKCPGQPQSPSLARQRKWLLQGGSPVTGKHLYGRAG